MRVFLRKQKPYLTLAGYLIFTLASFALGFTPGKEVFRIFTHSAIEILSILPFLFIIVGLLDAWFPKEKVEKHIGRESGLKGILVMIALAMMQAGPLYGAFPVAYILHKKGASIKNLFIYLGAFSSLRLPMLGVEIGYLGIPFTLARTLVSLPLLLAIGYFMEWYLKNREFKVREI